MKVKGGADAVGVVATEGLRRQSLHLSTALALILALGSARAQASVTAENDVFPGPLPNGASDWDVGGALNVGVVFNGRLTIDAGGTVLNLDGNIGYSFGSNGTVTVTGAGSTWTNSRVLSVGSSGTGVLVVSAGGRVSSAAGYVAEWPDSNGTVTVSGAGSTWTNSGFLEIGRRGNGQLTIVNGGAVDNTFGYIGNFSGSNGTVTVSGAGSSWTNSGTLSVGYWGTGELTISTGGKVSSAYSDIGTFSGSNGTVTVTGAGSTWMNSGIITVGSRGVGQLTIVAGGTVDNTIGYIGQLSGSKGTVTVTGAGSILTNSGDLIVGVGSTGQLEVEAGGAVYNANGFVGSVANSNGTVTVTGAGSTWVNSGSLTVGHGGVGQLTIENGGAVSNTNSHIGFFISSRGTVTVAGAGSTWANSGTLSVGHGGTGVLTIKNGGLVSVNDLSGDPWNVLLGRFGSGTINIGAAAGDMPTGAGTLSAAMVSFGAGVGTFNFNHTGSMTFTAALESLATPSPTTTHLLNHLAGTTTLTANSSAFLGTTSVSGGKLIIAGQLGGLASVTGGELVVGGAFHGDVQARTGGAVSGSGLIVGSASFADGGVLAGTQGETLSILGNVAMDHTSVVNVALGGAPTSTLFHVNGDLTIAGTLNVSDAGGFGAGVYRLFDYAGSLTNNGFAIGSTPAGVSALDLELQYSVSNQVNLISTAGAELGFWDGGNAALHDDNWVNGGSGTWRADGRNWTQANGAINGRLNPNPTFAVFQGVAGVVTVDNAAGGIGVTGMQFSTDGYRIEGDPIALEGLGGESIIRVGNGTATGATMTATIASQLTGASMLVKSDYGTLALSGSNTYSGGTRIDFGVLSVSADANLGDASGALTFNGGTLATTASFESGRSIALDMDGSIDVGAGTTLGLTGTIAGSGHLVKLGDGTLILTGSNLYSGDTLVQAGTLVGNAGSIAGNIGNASTVAFDQTGNGNFEGNILGLNGTSGAMVKRGAGILTLGGNSTLDWTIEAGGLSTIADRFFGNAMLWSGASLTFEQTQAAIYGGTLSGTGNFSVAGTGAVVLTGDSSAFAGTTRVTGNDLFVGLGGSGALGGAVTIEAGSLLAGTGNVGSAGKAVTINAGGVHEIWTSTGTQTVVGDYVNNGTLRIAATPNGAGKVIVHGQVDITGATLDLSLSPIDAASWNVFNGPFVIIENQSQSTVTGAFINPITLNLLFLDANLSYDGGDGNDVTLSLDRNDITFASIGQTRNQMATGAGVESLGKTNPIWASIALTSDEDIVRQSFDLLSGEIHASTKTALIEESRFLRNAINDRIRAAFDNAGAAFAPVLAYGPGDNPVLVSADYAGPAFWSQGFGSWGATRSDGNAAGLERSSGGLLIGVDGVVGDWRIGMLAGYSHSSFKVDDRAASGKSDNFHLGLYGGTQWGNTALRMGVAHTWAEIDTDREAAVPGIWETLSAGYDAVTFQAFGEVGYGFDRGNTRFEPFANLAYVNLRRNGFTEEGGGMVLKSNGSTTSVAFTTLGLRAEHNLAFAGMDATLSGMVGWRHAFGHTTPTSTHAFTIGDAFTVAGVPIARNSAVVELGLDVNLSRQANIGLSYTGQFADGAYDHGFKANFNARF